MYSPEKLIATISVRGTKAAQTKAAMQYREFDAKQVWAKAYRAARDRGLSVKDSEAEADLSPEYAAAIDEQIKATKDADIAKMKHRNGEIFCDLWRSMEASRRSEQKNLGG